MACMRWMLRTYETLISLLSGNEVRFQHLKLSNFSGAAVDRRRCRRLVEQMLSVIHRDSVVRLNLSVTVQYFLCSIFELILIIRS